MTMFECYDNIFGLSNFDCECLQEGRPENYNTSNSGLFLDELANISALVSADNCGKNIWDVLTAARTLAIKKLVADTNSMLGKKYKLKRELVKNQIVGKIKAQQVYDPSKNYAVIRIACNPIRSGFMSISNIGALFEATGAMTISLYDNVDGFIEDFDLNTLANKHNKNTVSKELPLFSKYTRCLEYYLVYEFDENNRPKDNEVHCGCGGVSLAYLMDSPYYSPGYAAAPWTQYVMVGSTTINSLADLEDMPSAASNRMLGITLELSFKCKVDEVLCKDALDFSSNPLAMSLAFAAMYKTAYFVADKVLGNTSLVPAQLMNHDSWLESKATWEEKYDEHVNYIVAEAKITGNDCLTCVDLTGMTRQGLFA